MILPLIGLVLGIIIGFIIPFNVPLIYSSYMSIAVLAALDSVFGGIRSSMEFDSNILFQVFGNSSSFLAYLGDDLGFHYIITIFAFGTRTIQNFM